jgi:hypothetical protein
MPNLALLHSTECRNLLEAGRLEDPLCLLCDTRGRASFFAMCSGYACV